MEPSDTDDVLRAVEADLDAVDAALERLDEGRYGACVGCGRPLPAAVLEADPLTDRCPASCPA